jgi:two-component system response regulator HydG
MWVSSLVIGSGLFISVIETKRFSKSFHEATIRQGEYLSQELALEATNKILINDLIGLQDMLNNHLSTSPSLAYIFVVKDGEVLAHTFSEGFPLNLVGRNAPQDAETGSFERIVNEKREYYLDIAWPIFSGKAGILRIGISEKAYRTKIKNLWLQMLAFTLGTLFLANVISFFFIRRFTRPLAALAEAAEQVDERNLELKLESPGPDEVGRLTSSFNKMIGRIRDYTKRLEKNAMDLERAQRQTTNSFEIIQKIWTQDNLGDVCSYLTQKLRDIVACSELALLIFSGNRETLFIFSEGKIKTFGKESFAPTLPALTGLEGFTYLKKDAFRPSLLPDSFHAAARIATFPIHHENQFLGAILIGCPGGCNCDTKEQDVISLILGHTSGAIKRAASREIEMLSISRHLDVTTEYCGIVGKDSQMQDIYKLIDDIAPSDTTVLIQGESGTGKELVAKAIHRKSLRHDEPFIVINCSAYPATLLESELFGHEKGSFTGAVKQKSGRFEQAHGGTVFLDEVGEIPPSAQIKLLRVIQTQKFERIGGERTLSVDVRIIAATNKELLQEVKKGRFREDLFYRLNVIQIRLPLLKNRRNDIPLLARYFMGRFADQQGKEVVEFSSEAMRLLLRYAWPGNVRELENCIEHAVVLAWGKRIEASDLPEALHPRIDGNTELPGGTITANEAKLLKEVLDECGWNKKEAARRLGISRNTLYRKLRKYQLNPPVVH